MVEEEINYRTLRKIQDLEKKSPVLVEIGDSFYSDLSNYLKGLEGRLINESEPQKLSLLKDELRNIEKIVKSIYESREKKILLAAISKARGGNPNLNHLLDEESVLYDSILKNMISSRKKIFEKKEEKDTKKDSLTYESNKINEEEKKIENRIPIVRVTEDIPEFIGTDTKRYNLRKGDVISLPEDMSNTLIKRGVSKKIEQQ